MDIIKCKECGEEISNKAKICTNCGCSVKKNNFFKVLVIVIVLLMVLGMLISFSAESKVNSSKLPVSSNTFKNILESNNYIVIEDSSQADTINAKEYYLADNGQIAFTYIVFDENTCQSYYKILKETAQQTINEYNNSSLKMIEESGKNYGKFKIQFPNNSGYIVCCRVENTIISCNSKTSYTKDYGQEIDYIYQQLGY